MPRKVSSDQLLSFKEPYVLGSTWVCGWGLGFGVRTWAGIPMSLVIGCETLDKSPHFSGPISSSPNTGVLFSPSQGEGLHRLGRGELDE